MDPWLATVYGTNGGAAEDLEKLAQAEMAQQLAAQEGIDLSQLSPEQIQALGQEVLGPEGQGGGEITEETFQQAQAILANPEQYDPETVQQAQGIMQQVEQMQAQEAQQQQMQAQQAQGAQPQQGQPGAPQQQGRPGMQFAPGQQQAQPQQAQSQQPGQAEMAKVAEAQAKFEEADFLGRVMAHSFNQESEKIAAAKQAGMGTHAMNAAAHVGSHLHDAGQAAKGAVHGALGHAKARLAQGSSSPLHHIGDAARHVGRHPTAYAAGAAGAAGLAAGHHMSKEATISVIEKAAMAQAANILQANGIDPATGQPVQQAAPQPAAPAGGVPQQSAPQALGELVEKRAHQILRNLGYRI